MEEINKEIENFIETTIKTQQLKTYGMWQKGHSETEDLKLHLKKPCSFYMESLGMITLGNTSLRTQSPCHEEDRQTERKKEKVHLTCVLWLLMNG